MYNGPNMKMGLRWLLIKKTFSIWQQLGFHITPNHYGEPIPDTRFLDDDIWKRESEMIGLNINEKKQIEFLDNYCSKYKNEYDHFGLYEPRDNSKYFVYNGWFGEIDGDILYCVIRHYKPKRVIEIGSGYSTYLIDHALNKNKIENNISSKITSIDPYPNTMLKNGIPDSVELIEKKVENLNIEFFKKLGNNDILFIDSSSIVKINSDVCYELLEILPRLNKGVLIHIHDIFLPKEYPRDWIINKKIFSNEAYLLQAFLLFNDTFEVIWAGNYMKCKYPEKCKKMFRSNASQSFWMKKIK